MTACSLGLCRARLRQGPTPKFPVISRFPARGPSRGVWGFSCFFPTGVPAGTFPAKFWKFGIFQKRVFLTRNMYFWARSTPGGRRSGQQIHISGKEVHVFGRSGIPGNSPEGSPQEPPREKHGKNYRTLQEAPQKEQREKNRIFWVRALSHADPIQPQASLGT